MNRDIFATVSIWPCPCDSSLSAHIVRTNSESMFQRCLMVASIAVVVVSVVLVCGLIGVLVGGGV